MIKGLKKVVDGKLFQGIILFVIIFNAAIMGVETIQGLPEGVYGAIALTNTVCLWIFIAEIIIKFLAYGLDYFKDHRGCVDDIRTAFYGCFPCRKGVEGIEVIKGFKRNKTYRSCASSSGDNRSYRKVCSEYFVDRNIAAPDLLYFRAHRSKSVR